ncbi:MAG: alpha/beta fold hydrolase [Acidimicrobiia bacterium]
MISWKNWLVGVLLVRALAPVVTPRFRQPQTHPWRQPGRTVFVADREFLVREAGPVDGPPIALIHGLAGSSLGEWYLVAPALAENHRVILIDHRSHGLSALSRGRYEISEVADDIAGVFDQLGVTRAHMVGYSLGATIAQAFAYSYPGRVDKMVLVGAFAHHPEPLRSLRSSGSVLLRGLERIFGIGTSDVRAGYLLATGAVKREHGRWLWEETHRRDVDAGAQATLAMVRFDSRDWLGKLEVETLVVIPTRDQLVPVAWQYQLASLLKSPTVVELVGARHEVPWVHPERLAEEIERFITPDRGPE